MKNFTKTATYGGAIAIIFGFLIYLETLLPFFKKFLPVAENKLIIVLLNINLLLILLLLFLVSRTLIKSYIERKRGIWGARLKTKLTLTLLLISIIPSLTLYVLASGFFQVSMDRWFGDRIEETIDSALDFSNFYYEDLFQRHERMATILVQEMISRKLLDDDAQLGRYVTGSTSAKVAEYLSVFDAAGNMIRSNRPLSPEIERKFAEGARKVAKEATLRSIIPLQQGELVLIGRKIVDNSGNARGILLLGEIIRVQGRARINEITAVSKEFKESRSFKKLLKYSFYVPLTLITLMTVFFSVWVGIKMATEITIPIERVKEGASIIAKGSFDINLEDMGTDEIGALVSAFNSMARELKIAKDEVEEKRRYLEAILGNVATGIISTDKSGVIIFLNRAAQAILGIEDKAWPGTPIKEIFGDNFRRHLKLFLREGRGKNGESITREMRLNLKGDVTYIRASLTTLKDQEDRVEGFLITFDDITHIVRAERLATWREVARKLTHEIKNPLTPIMLSAERIRRRLLPRAENAEREVLDDTTSVIIRSVDDIKGIVNELTKLTHDSQAKTVEDINAIVEATLGLYQNLFQNITFDSRTEFVPPFRIDRDGIKRALINLITNAIKAIGEAQGTIGIDTYYLRDRAVCIIEVVDTGKGIPDEDKGRIFDPYFTKDKDGMGLGLAIVHSIVLEHHGKIRVVDNKPRGTKFVIELPVLEA